jgi:hypothetical protein
LREAFNSPKAEIFCPAFFILGLEANGEVAGKLRTTFGPSKVAKQDLWYFGKKPCATDSAISRIKMAPLGFARGSVQTPRHGLVRSEGGRFWAF